MHKDPLNVALIYGSAREGRFCDTVAGWVRSVVQLRLVFAELHAVGLRDSVSFANAGERFDAVGRPLDAERAERSLGRMLAALEWWAAVLRHGRRVAPYDRRAA